MTQTPQSASRPAHANVMDNNAYAACTRVITAPVSSIVELAHTLAVAPRSVEL